MASYYTHTCPPAKPFVMYRLDKAGNMITDTYPDYLFSPNIPLTQEEKDAYDKACPGKLFLLEVLRDQRNVDDRTLLTQYLNEQGELIQFSEEWDRTVAEHVRLLIEPPGLVEDSDSDDDNEDNASTVSDDSDVSLPRSFDDSSDDFYYTSEEEDTPEEEEEDTPSQQQGLATRQGRSKPASIPMPASIPAPPSTLAPMTLKQNLEYIVNDAIGNGRLLILQHDREDFYDDESDQEQQYLDLVTRQDSITRQDTRQHSRKYNHIFGGPYSSMLRELFSSIPPIELGMLCAANHFPSSPTLEHLKELLNWGILSLEGRTRLTAYIRSQGGETGNTPGAGRPMNERPGTKAVNLRELRSELKGLLNKNTIDRAIKLATEMAKPDMVKKLKEHKTPELAILFLKYPTEVFVLDDTLKKSDQTLGVKAVSRSRTPVTSLTSECFVDQKIIKEEIVAEINSRLGGNTLRSSMNRFHSDWTSAATEAEDHLADHIAAFTVYSECYREDMDAADNLHFHASCLETCVPAYREMHTRVQDNLRQYHRLLSAADRRSGAQLLNVLRRFRNLSTTTIEDALTTLNEILDREEEEAAAAAEAAASVAYEDGTDEE